jgi:hypothetical protein
MMRTEGETGGDPAAACFGADMLGGRVVCLRLDEVLDERRDVYGIRDAMEMCPGGKLLYSLSSISSILIFVCHATYHTGVNADLIES